MSADVNVFSQQQFYAIGGEPSWAGGRDHGNGLTAAGCAGSTRATLFRNGPHPGFRTALLLDFGGPLAGSGPLAGRFGLWLAEHDNDSLTCLVCEHPPASRGVSGRVLRDLPALEPAGAWVQQLATDLARTHRGPASADAADPHDAAPALDGPARIEQATLQAALAAFQAELDADVLAAVRTEGVAHIATYNHYRTGDDRQRRNRLQAAITHPRFSRALRNDWRLRRAVDQGAPLTEALAQHFQVRAATIRRTRNLAQDGLGAAALTPVLKSIDALPDNAVPASPADWSVFLNLYQGLDTLARTTQADVGALAKPFAKGWRTGLTALEDRLQSPLDIDAVFELMHCTYEYGVRPAVQAALTAAGSRLSAPLLAPATFFPLWFGRYGLQRLAEMAGKWRQAHGQFSIARLGARGRLPADATLTWPALLSARSSREGLRVIELTSRHALELEGRRLKHCVASYAVKCLLADSSIFSIRDQHGQPLSTFEARVPTTGSAQLLQHHALANASPSAELDAVARRFVAHVLNGLPRETLAPAREARRAIGVRVRSLLGTPNQAQEPLTSAEVDSLAELVAFAHPAEARRMGIAPFLKAHGRPMIKEMFPA